MEANAATYGAILIGGLFASGFSGFVAVQCIIYFKTFPKDKIALKRLVLLVWLLDLAHTALVWSAIWDYLIINFGRNHYVDHIPVTVAMTIVVTATVTLLSHCFFAHRIHRLSHANWFFTVPVMVLALARLASAAATGAEMIRLQSFTLFRHEFRWLFSTGLGLSSGVDVLITILLFSLLRRSRSEFLSLDRIIDACILLTFETGTLTSAATVVSMICWLRLNNSLVFLGLHFVIGKFHANSLLASLNTREQLRRVRTTALDLMEVHRPRDLPPLHFVDPECARTLIDGHSVHVNVTKSVQYDK